MPARRIDRVAAIASALALACALGLSFVVLSPNRIVTGQPLSLLASAGVWAWAVIGASIGCIVASASPVGWRRRTLAPLGAALFGSVVFASGAAASSLTPDPASPARVSFAGGAWLLLVFSSAVWFQGWQQADRVSKTFSLAVGLGLAGAALVFGGLRDTSLAREYQTRASEFWSLVAGHIALAMSGVGVAMLIGVPAGVMASRSRSVRAVVVPFVGLIQTVPSLALLGLLIGPLAAIGLPAIGTFPALIALTLYALLPIVRNTYLGITSVDPAALDAGRGMGMDRAQLTMRVELPLAMPLVLEGVRAALVLIVGITAVMVMGGARNLGIYVFEGWGQQAADLTLLGAVPMVILAILADRGMRAVERVAVSPGIREHR
jgi:osmoprotectant transport system permease protein